MKMKKFIIWLGLSLLCGFFLNPLSSQPGTDTTQIRPIGFIDQNQDGINDLFQDADGDGKNDVTRQPYLHSFRFEDRDKNGINDLWIDRDGDGVNDLFIDQLKQKGTRPKQNWLDKDGDGILDADARPEFNNIDLRQFILDANQDGKNDITGLECHPDHVWGYRFGCIDEELNQFIKKYVDKNGDGMHDAFLKRFQSEKEKPRHQRKYDYFLDRDGDGIADDRGFGRTKNPRGRKQQGRKRGR